MATIDFWFGVSILAFIGLVVGLWLFWYPRDPLRRRREDPAPLRQVLSDGHFQRQAPPDGLFLLDDEMLLQRGQASFYLSRGQIPSIGGAVGVGGGWLFGLQPNRPGFTYQEAGILYLTSLRLIFIGPNQTYNLPLNDLVQVTDEPPWLTVWTRRHRGAVRFRLVHASLWQDAIELLRQRGASAIAG